MNRMSVAMIGRPNVGKSTLFNRLAQKNLAIVNPIPGTTRDWKQAEGQIGPLPLDIIDTGGLELSRGSDRCAGVAVTIYCLVVPPHVTLPPLLPSSSSSSFPSTTTTTQH